MKTSRNVRSVLCRDAVARRWYDTNRRIRALPYTPEKSREPVDHPLAPPRLSVGHAPSVVYITRP